MTNQEKVDFKNKLRMKSFGNQTISDNSLLDIGNGIILYPLEGNLIIFDCNIYKEIKRIFLSFSLIKIIKKFHDNKNYLICCENSEIFILNHEFKIISSYTPKEINNVYSLDISKEIKDQKNEEKIYHYISISHHSITEEDDKYSIASSKDALSLIEMEIAIKNGEFDNIFFNKIFTKQSINDFSLFNYKEENKCLELISIYWDEENKNNNVKVYNINRENIINNKFFEKEKIMKEMKTEIKRYKKLDNSNKLIVLCKKRIIYIFNLNNLSLEDSFKLEGVGEPGEFYVDEDKSYILMVNTTSQLIKINIAEKINPREIPLNKNENNLSEILLKDDFIRSMNWGLIEVICKNQKIK